MLSYCILQELLSNTNNFYCLVVGKATKRITVGVVGPVVSTIYYCVLLTVCKLSRLQQLYGVSVKVEL